MRATPPRRSSVGRLVRASALGALATVVLGCAAGAPPPGPIDIVREIFDPSYDYTQQPETWRDASGRPSRPPRPDDDWSSPCRSRDLSCTHEGVTVCCAPQDRCCAGATGPFCCSGEYARDGSGYDD